MRFSINKCKARDWCCGLVVSVIFYYFYWATQSLAGLRTCGINSESTKKKRYKLSFFCLHNIGHVVSPDAFNPTKLSTDQWVQAVGSFGARYAVLTLDHFSGFLLWPTETSYSYSVKNSKWRNKTGDVASDFMKSCVKNNIKYGFYFSVHENWFMGVNNYTTIDPTTEEIYKRLVEQQMIELFNPDSKYRDPFYIWFDAGIVKGVSPNVGPIIRNLAKDSICMSCPTFSGNQGLRWVGDEQAVAPLPLWNAVLDGQCGK